MVIEIAGLFVLGYIASVAAYLLGIGGGALIVPVLVLVFGFGVHEAVAVSLIVVVASALSITSTNLLRNQVNIRFALFLEFAAIVGAFSGGVASISMDGRVLAVIFACIMLLTALIMWKKSENDPSLSEIPSDFGEFGRSFNDIRADEVRYYLVFAPFRTMGVAFAAGIASGMLGLGGGVFKVPAMNILSRIPIKVAAATSNFMICFTAAAGFLPYLLKGHVDPVSAATMVLGALAGSYFATSRLSRVKNQTVKNLFILFLVVVAVQMVFKAVRG
jgi:uncharacterized membrane protein YfcA